MHPEPNEPKSVLASPSNSRLTEDYGVVALLSGLNAGVGHDPGWHNDLRNRGNGGIHSVEELLLRLSVSKEGEAKPFEGLCCG